MRPELGKIFRKKQEPRVDSLAQGRLLIEQRAAEHNAMTGLATVRFKESLEALRQRDDIQEIIPIIRGIVYAERVEVQGLWITSFIEAEGDLLKAWDLVDAKLQGKRDSWLNGGLNDTSEGE